MVMIIDDLDNAWSDCGESWHDDRHCSIDCVHPFSEDVQMIVYCTGTKSCTLRLWRTKTRRSLKAPSGVKHCTSTNNC